ncbi:MAG: hypothetical protein KF847_17425 [Pirellulales bacterium]|nr:hypothetical protein [Pirellulales bacterium]
MIRTLVLSAVVAAATAVAASAAPVSYTGGAYLQDFNGLPTTPTASSVSAVIPGKGPHDFPTTGVMASAGMEGWTMSNYDGSSVDTEYRAQNGSQAGNAGRGVVSFGTINSAERALGVLATSNQISRFGLALINDSSTTYDQFTLDFVGEQWRRGNVAAPGNAISYDWAVTGNYGSGVGQDNINTDAAFANIGSIASPNNQPAPTELALDGNLPANQVSVSTTVTGLNWTPGSVLMLRWSGQDLSGQDDGLAIDDLRFSASAVPEPGSIALAGLVLGALTIVDRRRRS